jgi:hypothetical protein
MILTRFEALGLLPDKPTLAIYTLSRADKAEDRKPQRWTRKMEEVIDCLTIDQHYRGNDVRLAFDLVTLRYKPTLGYLICVSGPTFKFYLKADMKKCRRLAKRYGCKLPPRQRG